MLHIVNGDTIVHKLTSDIVPGEVIAWREIYTEGALAPLPSEPTMLKRRAVSLNKRLGIPEDDYIRQVLQQEQRLQAAIDQQEEIVLWFEHDLFDQTILWYLLYRLKQSGATPSKWYLLSINNYPGIEPFLGMGQLSTEQFKTLAGKWKPITAAQLQLGRRTWEAYSSDSPNALLQLLTENTDALPFLKDAAQFHLSRFPSKRNGLGIVQMKTLAILATGPQNPLELFRLVGHSHPVSLFGMGDLQFWAILKDMCSGNKPLLQLLPASRGSSLSKAKSSFPNFINDHVAFHKSIIQLTEQGRKVYDGTVSYDLPENR